MPARTSLWSRIIAVAVCCGAILEPPWVEQAALAVLVLLWPPAFLIEWRLGSTARTRGAETPLGAGLDAQLSAAAVIIAAALGALYYQWITNAGLQQTSALFVGVPAVLAVAVVFGVTPHSATGVACKAVTVGLLVSLLFLGEGVLCVAMSAPLFYLVAVVVGKTLDKLRDDDTRAPYTLRASAPIVVILAMSLEGVHDATTIPRDAFVTVSKIVAAPAASVEKAIVQRPRFERALPELLRAGFPRPIATAHAAPRPGARWTIVFRGGEMRIDGLEPRIGDLTLELVEYRPGVARWRALGDDSHMTHYLAWQGSDVRWTAVSPTETRVEWTLRYRRSLDPAWYFGPIEQFAVRLAAGYLIDAVATP
jgi:hypothetical protein